MAYMSPREALDRKIRQAQKNASRQRIREEQGLPVRVASSFWEQAERELRREKRNR